MSSSSHIKLSQTLEGFLFCHIRRLCDYVRTNRYLNSSVTMGSQLASSTLVRFSGCMIGALLLAVASCDSQVFVKDGVTDGTSFSVPPEALQSKDPITQSWIAYSLARGTCQIAMGGDNPARDHSFDCELRSRKILLQAWQKHKTSVDTNAGTTDAYLDALDSVNEEGYLYEYVWTYLRRDSWQTSARLKLAEFKRWQQSALTPHKPQTRIIGSWSYPPNND